MNVLSRNDGFIKPLLVILILVFACYTGLQFGIPYYRYSALKADAVALARISLGREEKLRNMITERAQELNVQLNENDLYVEKRYNDKMFVSLAWSEDVDIFGLYGRTLHFKIEFVE